MTSDSNLPRRYSEEEVSEMLKHATDLQAEETGSRPGSSGGMTLAEIQEIASEVGIEPRHLQTAAARLDHPEPSGLGVALAGGPLVVSVERVVPGEMREDDFARIVPDIQRVSTGHGNATLVGSTLTYSAETGQKQRTLQVVVSSQDGQTLIRAEERLHGLAGALFGGLVGGGGTGLGIGMGVPLGLEALGSTFLAFAIPATIITGCYALARTIMKRTTRRRHEALSALVDQIAARVPSPGALGDGRTAGLPPGV